MEELFKEMNLRLNEVELNDVTLKKIEDLEKRQNNILENIKKIKNNFVRYSNNFINEQKKQKNENSTSV